MTIAPDNAQQGATHLYRAMRDFVESTDGTLPGKFEITKEGIALDMMSPVRPHELTTLRLRKRLEKVMPEEIVAHTGEPDVELVPEGILRRPDIMVIAEADMEGQGSFDPRTLIAAVEIVSRSNPDNDWVTKLRDYPLIGIPVYAIFDPRTATAPSSATSTPRPTAPATPPARTSSTARTSPSPTGRSPPGTCHGTRAKPPNSSEHPSGTGI